MWVEALALSGVIPPADQMALAHELWDYINPQVAGNYSAPGWGTTINQMMMIQNYLIAKYHRTITMSPVLPTVDSINGAFVPGAYVMLAVRLDVLRPELHLPPDGHWLLGRSDTGRFVHYLDSCAAIDFSPDVNPTETFAQACEQLVGTGQTCGWSVLIG